MQILLADDDIDNIEIFHEALKEVLPSAELITAQTGQEVLSKVQTCEPTVIFLDINMPEMSGWECLVALKSDARVKHIPVIIFTTAYSPREIGISKDLGAYRLITKPDRIQDLNRILLEIVEEITE